MIANGCNLAGDVPTLGYVIEDRGDGPAVEWGVDPVAVTASKPCPPSATTRPSARTGRRATAGCGTCSPKARCRNRRSKRRAGMRGSARQRYAGVSSASGAEPTGGVRQRLRVFVDPRG